MMARTPHYMLTNIQPKALITQAICPCRPRPTDIRKMPLTDKKVATHLMYQSMVPTGVVDFRSSISACSSSSSSMGRFFPSPSPPLADWLDCSALAASRTDRQCRTRPCLALVLLGSLAYPVDKCKAQIGNFSFPHTPQRSCFWREKRAHHPPILAPGNDLQALKMQFKQLLSTYL